VGSPGLGASDGCADGQGHKASSVGWARCMLTLVIQDSEFLVESDSKVLVISRSTGEVHTIGSEKAESARAPGAVPKPIVGVLGVIEVPDSLVLAVVTETQQAGAIQGAPVYRVTGTELFPLASAAHRSKPNNDDEYLQLLQSHLDAATLFFSPRYDLSSSLQRQAALRQAGKPTIDDQFVWNWHASQRLLPFPEFVFPVIYGVFSAASVVVSGTKIEFGVLSRRCRFRAGTRYFRRGLDADGHAANFNETEQIVAVGSRIFSYLQTRGSVPGFWSEINDLQYKPKLRIGDVSESVAAAKLHFAEQEKRYGHQYLVNLVNQTGYEKPVKELYESVVRELRDPNISYIYFDFHHECSKMRWHRVQLLIDELKSQGLDRTGYFEADAGTVVNTQSASVRTNCMDCLDRTNVVQSTLALYELERQLQAAGVLRDGSQVVNNQQFVKVFRQIWADNADGVSVAYSGTGALKTDFTRTGQRTKLGALQDLRNSIVRYYRNNLCDGPRQDGFSLFLGDYAQPVGNLPFVDRRPVGIQALPYLGGGCALVTVLSILYPSETHSTLFNSVVTLAFALVAVVSTKVVFAHGLQYVNWPKLSSVRFVQWTPKGYAISGEHRGSKEE